MESMQTTIDQLISIRMEKVPDYKCILKLNTETPGAD
jgi:hypothetical protein